MLLLIITLFFLVTSHSYWSLLNVLWWETHCALRDDYASCVKKYYIKRIILQKGIVEREVPNGKKYIASLDKFFKKYSEKPEKLEIIQDRAMKLHIWLGDSQKELQIKKVLEYIIYKNHYLINYSYISLDKYIEIIPNYEDVLKLSEKKLENYILSISLEELEKLINQMYWGEEELYQEVIKTYNVQIEKARDTTRIFDLYALQSAIEQTYQDDAEYPSKENFKELVSVYMPNIPKDSLAGFTIDECDFWYIYEVGLDKNGINNGNYRLSTCFENKDYISDRATQDRGDDDLRFEKWYWDDETNFTQRFYINDISDWEYKVSPKQKINSWNLDSLDDEMKRGIYFFMLGVKYMEYNSEVIEK